MRLCDNITVKVLVWLSAMLVPVETLPSPACNCGGCVLCSAAPGSGRADPTLAAECPHCTRASQPRHSCCGSTSGSSAPPESRRGNAGSCCGKGTSGAPGGPCRCSKSEPSPAPDPLPRDSRTHDTKSLTSAGCGDSATVAILGPLPATACADRRSIRSGSSAPERLSVLCRLLI